MKSYKIMSLKSVARLSSTKLMRGSENMRQPAVHIHKRGRVVESTFVFAIMMTNSSDTYAKVKGGVSAMAN